MPEGSARQDSAEHSVELTLGHLRAIDGPVPVPPPAAPLTLEDLYRQQRMRLVRLAILLGIGGAVVGGFVAWAAAGLPTTAG